MAILPIKIYPDPILRQKTEEVKNFNADLRKFLDSIAATMYEANGIGLASPQVGISKRVAVADVSREGQERIDLVNPQIVWRDGSVPSEEGCLSIPEYRETIKRSREVIVQARDADGKEFELRAEGLLAICLQHEIDHLDGVLFIDHLSRLKRELFKRWLKKQDTLE